MGCSLSKKHKLALYKTQSGEKKYLDNKFSLNVLLRATYKNLGDRHQNTIELASWLVHVLCEFKAT